jgi:hypothetical protein
VPLFHSFPSWFHIGVHIACSPGTPGQPGNRIVWPVLLAALLLWPGRFHPTLCAVRPYSIIFVHLCQLFSLFFQLIYFSRSCSETEVAEQLYFIIFDKSLSLTQKIINRDLPLNKMARL